MALSSEYAVSLTSAEARTIAAVRARVSVRDVPATFRRYLDQVYAVGRSGSIKLDGQNVFVYREVPGGPHEADVAFGVGVADRFEPIGNVQPVTLPLGPAATTTHWGDYAGLGAAHHAITAWCAANGHRLTGTRWEVYGHWTADERQIRTDVFHLLGKSE